MRIFLCFIIAFVFLFPAVSFAADARCFTRNDCITERGKMMSKNDAEKNPLYQGTDSQEACGGKKNGNNEDIGFCYPATNAKTQISFAGKTEFTNIGEFLQFGYRFAVVVASVIAVIMIIIAGFQWTTSGGSADKIKSAQKRISGSMMGLILAVLSYFILNTINPYLVNFRLPQAWLINVIGYEKDFCRELENKDKELFALAAKTGEKIDGNKFASSKFDIKYEESGKTLTCGNQYFYKSGNGGTCGGNYCVPTGGKTNTCVKQDKTTFACVQADISGWITNSTKDLFKFVTREGWDDEGDVVNDMEVHLVCTDGSTNELYFKEDITPAYGNAKAPYTIAVEQVQTADEAKKLCPGEVALGLILFPDFDENLDITDEAHYLGIKPAKKNLAIDLGDSETSKIFFTALKSDGQFKGINAKEFLIPLSALDTGYELNIDTGDIVDLD